MSDTKTKAIQALLVNKGKKQHMQAGKVYAVTPELSKILIDSGQAKQTTPTMEVGKTYKLPKGNGPGSDFE